MGVSVSVAQSDKRAKLVAEGRACGGPVLSRLGCLTRATWWVTTEAWWAEIGEGERHEKDRPFCKRHADQLPVGLEGKNFRVLARRKM